MIRRILLLLLIAAAAPGTLLSNTLYFPQVVFGGGYSTTLVIWNTGTTAVASRANFYDQSGTSRTTLGVNLNVAAGGSTRYTLPDTGPLTQVWAEFAAGGGTVQGIATLDLRSGNGDLVTSVELPGVEAGNSFVLPVEVSPGTST